MEEGFWEDQDQDGKTSGQATVCCWL